MKLKILPRCNAQRVVRVGACQMVARDILVGGDRAARKFGTDHELKMLAAALSFVPVVLLIHPVKLQEFVVVMCKAVQRRVRQSGSHSTAEQRKSFLQPLIASGLFRRVSSNHKLYTNVT